MLRLASIVAVLTLAVPASATDVVFNPGRHPTTLATTLLTPDGKSLVILGSDRCLRLWDVESGKPVAEVWLPTAAGFPKGDSYFRSLLWVSPDSKLLAVPLRTNEEPRARIAILPLSGADRGTYRVVGGHGWGVVDNAVFSPDGKAVATSAGGQPVIVWEVATGKKVCEIKFDHDMRASGMAFTPDGKKLTVALPMVNFNSGKHSGVSTFDAATGKFLGEIVWKEGLVEQIGHPRWSPDGKTLAVKRWEMELLAPDGTNSRAISRPDALTIPDSGAFDSKGRFLVAWRKEGEYIVRNELAGKEIARFKATGGQLQFSTDGSRMLTVDEGDATLHDLTGRGQTKTVRVAEPAPAALAWAEGPKLGLGFGQQDRKNAGALSAAFDFDKFALAEVIVNNDYTRARKEWGGVKLNDLGYSANAVAGGKDVPLDYEMEFDWEDIKASTLVGPDHAVLYTGKGTLGYDTKTGKQVASYPSGASWALAPSRDGKLFAMGNYTDPAVRIYKPRQSEPVLTLYVAGGEWIAWTASGAWDSSPGGAKLVGALTQEEPGKLRTFVPLPKERHDPAAVRKALK